VERPLSDKAITDNGLYPKYGKRFCIRLMA